MRHSRWPLVALPLLGLCAAGLSISACRKPAPAPPADEARQIESLASLRHELEADDSQARRALFRFARVYPTGRLPEGAYGRAVEAMKRLEAGITPAPAPPGPPGPPGAPAPSWKPLGSSPLDVTATGLTNLDRTSGRTTALASPDGDPKTLYLGTAQGGVWKSVDSGQSWVALTDDQPSLAIGDIALDPKKPGRVWVGTGEGHTGSISYYGRGLLLSDDGGSTWNRPAGDKFSGVSIVRVVVDPKADAVYVATLFDSAGRGICHGTDYDAPDQGVFKSTDGGKSWAKLLEGPMTDLEADFSGPKPVLFAAKYADGVHKIEDGGASPQKLSLPDKAGSPATLGVQLALAPSDPKVIYASVSVTDNGYASSRGTLFRSTDSGASWAELPKTPDFCHDQCDYDNALTVDPKDAGTVYFGGSLCSVWKATSATGEAPSFSAVSLPGGECADSGEVWTKGYVHPDLHALFVHPTSGELWAMSDGGVALSPDGGKTWSAPNVGLDTLQFYGGCLPPGDVKTVLGGTQDNGFAATVGGSAWKGLLTGDGVECVTAPDNSLLFNVVGGFMVQAKLKKGKPGVDPFSVAVVFDPSCQTPGVDGCGDAQRATFAPLAADPADPTAVYTATYRVYRSTEGGKAGTWKPISGDVTGGESGLLCTAYGYPGEYPAPDMIVDLAVTAGGTHIYTTSAGGAVAASHDGGKTFAVRTTDSGLPPRYASGVAVDASSPTSIWVAYSGFSSQTPGASGHVFHSTDGGMTFTGSEPGGVDAPVDSIAAHPVAPGVLFVGTDVGALASYDGGKTFAPVATGLPNVAVYSVLYDARASRLVALTHGRSAWSVAMPAELAASPGKLSLALKPGKQPAGPLMAKIKNSGHPGALARPQAASSEAWAQVPADLSPVAGSVEADLPVTLDASGLDLGVHTATITVTDAISPTTPKLELTVELTISDSAPEQGQGGQAGASGQGGSSGKGGSSPAGQAGQAGSSQPGSAGAGGLPTPPSQAPAQPAPSSGDDGGCGCQVPGGSTPSPWALLALGAAAAVAGRKRRRLAGRGARGAVLPAGSGGGRAPLHQRQGAGGPPDGGLGWLGDAQPPSIAVREREGPLVGASVGWEMRRCGRQGAVPAVPPRRGDKSGPHQGALPLPDADGGGPRVVPTSQAPIRGPSRSLTLMEGGPPPTASRR